MGSETESMVERVAKAIRERDIDWHIARTPNVSADVIRRAAMEDLTGNYEALARAAIDPVIDHAVAIMEARMPLYTDIAARNAIRECISSIKADALVKALEE